MKKINILISFLILISFIFLYNVKIVNAGTATWAETIFYPDSSTHPGSKFTLWCPSSAGGSYEQTIKLNTITTFSNRNYLNIDAKIVVQDTNLFVGSFVKASMYILTDFPIVTGRNNYYSPLDHVNDYVDVVKVDSMVPFRNSSLFGNLYKLTFSFRNQDCLDSEFGDYYICYGDAYTRSFMLMRDVVGTYNIQLYGFGEVTYSDVIYTYPDQDIEDLPKLSAWETVKALPRNLLNWFTSLPTNIWNFIKDLPSLTWEFFKHLPSSIFGVFSPAMNALSDVGGFILDSINNLYQNDEIDIDLSDFSNASGWLPPGPVDSILNLPFNFLNNLNNNLSKECTPVNIPLPYVNKNLPLPCVNSLYDSIPGLNVWISSTSIIIAGIIGFKYLINLYKWVDDTLSFRENNHLDNWGGL